MKHYKDHHEQGEKMHSNIIQNNMSLQVLQRNQKLRGCQETYSEIKAAAGTSDVDRLLRHITIQLLCIMHVWTAG